MMDQRPIPTERIYLNRDVCRQAVTEIQIHRLLDGKPTACQIIAAHTIGEENLRLLLDEIKSTPGVS